MITVGQLAQYLLLLDPQKNSARLAFYHFLKNFLPLDLQFKQEFIDEFFDRALGLQHWQTHKKQLGETVKSDLEGFAARYPIGFDLDQAVYAHELQVVPLENNRDFAALLSREVSKMEKNDEKVKSFSLADKAVTPQDILFVRLKRDGSVIVEIRQNIAVLVDGELQLLRPHSRLTYTPELDFEPHVDQFLSTSLMRLARFSITAKEGNKLRGRFIQGSSFHCAENFERPLEDVPELFQALKKVERFYVNPVTDPYYHRLMENFEQAFREKDL